MKSNVIVVTEPGPRFRDRHGSVLLSPVERPNAKGPEAWVGILGHSLETVTLEIDYRRLAVAGRTVLDGTGVLIYGSVLPWLSARTHAPDVYGQSSRPFIDVFETALNEQVAEMSELRSRYPSDALVWAGDFNHTLTDRPVSRKARDLLRTALTELGLKAVNASSPHRMAGMSALDLICVDEAWKCAPVEDGYPLYGDQPLSDHRWYVAEVSP